MDAIRSAQRWEIIGGMLHQQRSSPGEGETAQLAVLYSDHSSRRDSRVKTLKAEWSLQHIQCKHELSGPLLWAIINLRFIFIGEFRLAWP